MISATRGEIDMTRLLLKEKVRLRAGRSLRLIPNPNPNPNSNPNPNPNPNLNPNSNLNPNLTPKADLERVDRYGQTALLHVAGRGHTQPSPP